MTTQVTKSVLVNVPVSTRVQPVDAVRGFPPVHGWSQEGDPARRRAVGMGRGDRWGPPAVEGQDPGAGAGPKGGLGGDRGRDQRRCGDLRGCRWWTDVGAFVLEYEPEGLVEKVGDKLHVVEPGREGSRTVQGVHRIGGVRHRRVARLGQRGWAGGDSGRRGRGSVTG